MPPGQLGVDVVALRGIGTEVAAAATTLRQATEAAGSGLAPAPGAGSSAATAAQAAEKAWLADLRRLTGQVTEFGESLIRAAQEYQARDQANADNVRRSGSRVPL
ncbi:type VII secretion target [Actinoplanes sp. NPDC024001]|uniref:type VII secretion target n=1 Tax=Actinoplanes sp. NPDC024001 TaxID=3154598 RepID=UPI0033DF0177